jgi:hypothetical protein
MGARWRPALITALGLTAPVALAVAAAPGPPGTRGLDGPVALHRHAAPGVGERADPGARRTEVVAPDERVRNVLGLPAIAAPADFGALEAPSRPTVAEGHVAAGRQAGIPVGVAGDGESDRGRVWLAPQPRTAEGGRSSGAGQAAAR